MFEAARNSCLSRNPLNSKSGGRARTALLVFLALLFSLAAIPTEAAPSVGVGCEPDTSWDSPSSPECVLEYPAETRVLMGVRFRHNVAVCPSPYGAGTDGLVYARFTGVKPNGVLEAGKTYNVEAWLSHDCRDFSGAYDLDVYLVAESGERAQLDYKSESYYSYRSRRISAVGLDYCLMYSCGSSTFKFEMKVPRSMTLGAATLLVRAHTDPTKDKLGFGSVDSTFHYPNVFTITAPPNPEPTSSPTLSTKPSQSPVVEGINGNAANAGVFQNCSALWKKYPGGVAFVSRLVNRGEKIYKKPTVSYKIYSLNKALDRDKDGIVCER